MKENASYAWYEFRIFIVSVIQNYLKNYVVSGYLPQVSDLEFIKH